MSVEQRTYESRVRRFASKRRLQHLMSELDWERFGGDMLEWPTPPIGHLMILALPLASIVQERADTQKRDYTRAEVEFLIAVDGLQP